MSGSELSRRGALRLGGCAAIGLVGIGGTATAESGWFSNVSNYEGVVDRTGRSEVTVRVGVAANGGAFGFGPAAVRVDPGTTVVWEWTGKGGAHNVVAKDGSFESELVDDPDHAFSHTFEAPGATAYYCAPHESMGMKGAILVGDAASVGGTDSAGTDEPSDGSAGSEADGTGTEIGDRQAPTFAPGDDLRAKAVAIGLALAVLSPLGFMFADAVAGEDEQRRGAH